MTDIDDSQSKRTSTGNTRRLLVPIDGSDHSFKAVEHTCLVHPDADITLVHVLEAPTSGVYESIAGGPSTDFERLQQQREEQVESLFEEARDVADEYDVEFSTTILNGTVAEAILTHAIEIKADQILMGSRGRHRISQALLGGVSEKVIRLAAVPVTVVR